MSLKNDLVEMLHACAVRLSSKQWQGTGFFIQPMLIATCAHVVASEDLSSGDFKVEWNDQTLRGLIVSRFPAIIPATPAPILPDIAFIRVENAEGTPFDHPWVMLDDKWTPGDALYSFGFPKGRLGESLSGELEGVRVEGKGEDSQLLKFKQTQVQPGASGSPVLNWSTLRVCGMIKRTRDDESDLGGLAVTAGTLKKYLLTHPQDLVNCPAWELAEAASISGLARTTRSSIEIVLQRYRAGLRASALLRQHEEGPHLETVLVPFNRAQGDRANLANLLDTSIPVGTVLLGEAGQGKSFAMESLAIEQFRRDDAMVPVLLPLRFFVGEISLTPLLCETLSSISGLPVAEAQVEAILDAGCLVLADGLNEIASEHRDKAARLIGRLAAAHPKTRVIVSCRTSDFADFRLALAGFEMWALRSWTLADIRRYLRLTVPGALVEGYHIQEQGLVEMFSNPLLLRLAVESGTDTGIPSTPTGLLQKFVDGDRVTGAIFPSARRRQTLRALQGVAWSLHRNQKLAVPVGQVATTLESELHNHLLDPDEVLAQLQRAGLMWADERRSGFSHQFIQEYFAALFLASNADPGRTANLASDPWWRECLCLYLDLPDLDSSTLESFLAPSVDRWVRYAAARCAFQSGRMNDEEMIPIPGGSFTMGREDATPSEAPSHEVNVASFRMGRYPVTNRLYAQFVRETGYAPPKYWPRGLCPHRIAYRPVVNVSFEDAQAFCRWRRVRLPSEAEWEFAASWFAGTQKSVFPWGDDFEPQRLNCDVDARYSVGEATIAAGYLHGASRLGVCDMSGNVWEWTSSPMRSYPFDPSAIVGRDGPPVLRGGSWRSVSPTYLTTTFRDSFDQDSDSGHNVGFRIASDI